MPSGSIGVLPLCTSAGSRQILPGRGVDGQSLMATLLAGDSTVQEAKMS